ARGRAPARGPRRHARPRAADPRLLQRQRIAVRRRAPRARREPPAPRPLARDPAGAACRAHRALRRARPGRRADRPGQANPARAVSWAATTEHSPHSAIRPRLTPKRRRGMTAGIFGIGAALPEHVITNADLEKRLDTNDEWIVRRTG